MKKLLILFFILPVVIVNAQTPADTLRYKTIAANPSLQQRTGSWQKAWGTNRRVEWGTPVTVPVLWLDTVYGGLKPYQAGGGGNETKSFRLKTKEGKEYSLRSVNKSREEVIEDRFRGSFVEDIINDQLSSSYPYGAFPISIMMDKAGIYHPTPVLVYLPKQPALDTFNSKYGDDLYMLEQRPDGDWSDADNLGNFKKFSSTEKVIAELLEDNDADADQYAFIKARLFDMLIGDWDRHEDNFRWGKRTVNDKTLYTPVPRDRDQAFYTHNGKLIDKMLPLAGFSYMQHFDHQMGNVKSFNNPERYFDRFFSNEMDMDNWVNAATDLQRSLTDDVITRSVQQLPPEIFAVSGNELIEKLISRRGQLDSIAKSYYLLIAKEVDIAGTEKREHFHIKRDGSGETVVSVYKISKKGKKDEQPFYHRKFKPEHTTEVRIHGIGGEDVYDITGNSPITIRIIGGPGKDSMVQSGSRVYVYDNGDNIFQTSSARKHLSNDSAIHAYKYKNFEYDSKGFSPAVGYEHEDRIYVGLNWSGKKYKWRREPFASRHNFDIKYSIVQHNINTSYGFVYPRIIGKWDIFFKAKYDGAVWRNFPGPGNETIWNELFDNYYQVRSHELTAATGIRRQLGKNEIELSVLYHLQENKSDGGRYATTVFSPSDLKLFDKNNYGGLRWKYNFVTVNDDVVPTKGFSLAASGSYLKNFSRDQFFQNYSAKLQTWLPLSKKFSLCIRAGGETIVGPADVLNNALFIQHAVIGGPENFRGYRRERFWGKTSFYNNNELHFITNMRTHLLNAKIGLIAFVDDGRVWMPGESSDTWHSSYGGGLLLAPFHFTCFTLTYGISNEMKIFQFKMNTLF
ncbi:MAG: hypothetical protein HOP10_09895 [Chitinophagaceae bacterium]|nr:hypothetical protein [Chitinophagaceae bacterium]